MSELIRSWVSGREQPHRWSSTAFSFFLKKKPIFLPFFQRTTRRRAKSPFPPFLPLLSPSFPASPDWSHQMRSSRNKRRLSSLFVSRKRKRRGSNNSARPNFLQTFSDPPPSPCHSFFLGSEELSTSFLPRTGSPHLIRTDQHS